MRIAVVLALAAFAFPGAALAQDNDEPIPTTKPIGNPGSWIPQDGYPPAARASGEQGRVSFTLSIDETGRVSDCKVTKSSESPLLDETTCNFMTANGRFEVPRNKKNKPTPSKWSSSMMWKLETPPPPPEPTGVTSPATAAAPRAGSPVTPLQNPGSWVRDAEVPSAARKGRGTVSVRLDVAPSGMVSGCTIIKSDASPALNAATCAMFTRNGRFKPARDASGNPIASTYTVPGIHYAF
ncbi:energy transducer TonB [Sphingomonas sp.]|uniref:energy transducer TonB n=1 Tax=Sphingomonas sp. TaxID=28214 RepID=UPI0025CD4020|nr:energy transducer TonB [Sphingomonas sp.]